ncbi:radical SAM protein, partial [human gut metagenome]
EDERIAALSIGTRPDCLPPDIIGLLDELNKIKPVFVELGLQTSNEARENLYKGLSAVRL